MAPQNSRTRDSSPASTVPKMKQEQAPSYRGIVIIGINGLIEICVGPFTAVETKKEKARLQNGAAVSCFGTLK